MAKKPKSKTAGTEVKASPVPGYRPLSEQQISLMTRAKRLEEEVLRFLDTLEILARPPTSMYSAPHSFQANGRDVALARTYIENGFMRANRSIAQPQRINLPHDPS